MRRCMGSRTRMLAILAIMACFQQQMVSTVQGEHPRAPSLDLSSPSEMHSQPPQQQHHDQYPADAFSLPTHSTQPHKASNGEESRQELLNSSTGQKAQEALNDFILSIDNFTPPSPSSLTSPSPSPLSSPSSQLPLATQKLPWQRNSNSHRSSTVRLHPRALQHPSPQDPAGTVASPISDRSPIVKRQAPPSHPIHQALPINPVLVTHVATPSSPVQAGAAEMPSSSTPSSSPTIILPEHLTNVTERHFRYTPATGANNSLYITPNVTNHEGMVEIKIGVLLPYSLPNNVTQALTYSGTSALRLAAAEINAQNTIPGAFVTLVLKDSFNGNDPDNSGAAQAIFSTVSLLQLDGVVGVIGDVSSALTVQSALLTSRLSIPQCSFSAGSTQLSSKEDYGHFFRTIPTELMFGKVMMDFVASRGWKKIAVFYTGDPLGSELMDNIAFQANERNITIAFRRSFWELGASSDVAPAVTALKDSGIQIVLIAAVGQPQIRLMMEAIRQGLFNKDYVWMVLKQVTEPLLGMKGTDITPEQLNGLFMFDNLLKLTGYPPFEQFLDKWSTLDPLEYPYAGQRDISSNEAQAYSCLMVMARGMARAVKGNWTALHMLANGRLGSVLHPGDMNTGYIGPGGPMAFDENGDVVYGNFILYNFQHGEVVPIGTSYTGMFNLTSPPMYFDGTYDTPRDSAPLRVLNPTFGSSVGMVIISVSGLFILFSILIIIIVITYRQAQVIKASSPLFCCLELFGFILLYFSTIMSLDIPKQFNCVTRPVVLNIGFVLVVSNIVAKNFRVYRIFHNIYVTKRVIHDSHLLKIVGSLMMGNLIIMTIWFARYPPVVQQTAMSNFTAYWTCDYTQGHSMPFFAAVLVYDVVLLLVATYLAYMNRNVAANYNECRQISFVVYNILLCGVLTLPTLFLPKEQFITTFILTNVVILFGTTFSVGFMFVPKLYKLFTQLDRQANQRQDSTDESSLNSILNQAGGGNNQVFGGSGGPWLGGGIGGGFSSNIGDSHLQHTQDEHESFHWTGGRKGSVTTLDESKGDTLHESHMGFMGVKVQHRYLPLLSNWRMRCIVLFPHHRYFMSFEHARPETARTYPYKSVVIESRSPGKYILRVVGSQWNDFLLQVKDEERLLHWYSLFDMRPPSTYYSTAGIPTTFLSTSTVGLLGNLVVRPSDALHSDFHHQDRNESSQTLHIGMDPMTSANSSRLSITQPPRYQSSDGHHLRHPHFQTATGSSYTVGAFGTDLTTSPRSSSILDDGNHTEDDDDHERHVSRTSGAMKGQGQAGPSSPSGSHDSEHGRRAHPVREHPLQQHGTTASNDNDHNNSLLRPAIVVHGAGTRFSMDQYQQPARTPTTSSAQTPRVPRRPSVASSTPSHRQSQLRHQQARAASQEDREFQQQNESNHLRHQLPSFGDLGEWDKEPSHAANTSPSDAMTIYGYVEVQGATAELELSPRNQTPPYHTHHHDHLLHEHSNQLDHQQRRRELHDPNDIHDHRANTTTRSDTTGTFGELR